jgi:hypothetical protein
MVDKRSKQSRRDEVEPTPQQTLQIPATHNNPSQTPAAPSGNATSLPVILDIGEQNSTSTGVDDQPDSSEERDDEILDLIRQAPGN